jgi:error-prone DNA polymerase
LIRDARQHGVEVRPVDVNHSDWDCTLEGERVLRLGFRLIRGLSAAEAQAAVRGRAAGPYRSVDDFAQRSGLFQAALSKLAEADAFGSLECGRRQALWGALAQQRSDHAWPLWEAAEAPAEPAAVLPAATLQEEVLADYQTTGFSLRPHPLSFYRARLQSLGVQTAASLAEVPANRPVKVAGLVILRQRPSTGKGITFVTLEDETGIANLVVQKAIWERFHQVTRHSNAWIARGRLESRHRVIHVVVQHVQDLQHELGQLVQSRDFR